MRWGARVLVAVIAAGSLGCGGVTHLNVSQSDGGGLASHPLGADAAPSDASGGSATLPNGRCVEGAFPRDGACMCLSDNPTVCNMTCTDLTTDDQNCGACGHACPATSTCHTGTCGPSVTNVVPAAPGCVAISLAIVDGTIYWADQGHGTVKSRSVAGGPDTTISSTEASPELITASGSSLYWIDIVSTQPVVTTGFMTTSTTATLRKATLPSGTPADLVTETNLSGGIRGLVASEDGGTIYYSADTNVRAVPAAGGTAVDVGHEALGGIPTALGLQGNAIGYITDLNGNVDIITAEDGVVASCGAPDPANPNSDSLLMVNCVRVGGCGPSPLFSSFILRDHNAYWGDSGNVYGALDVTAAPAGTIFSKEGVATSATELTGLVGGPDNIYFGESEGVIEKAAYAPSSIAIPIARGQDTPSSLAVDATKVYWSTGDCAINSTPR
jgi:hypothetical protein